MRAYRQLIRHLLLLPVLIGLVACGGGGGGTANDTPPLSSDATLSELRLSAGSFNPTFSATTENYDLTSTLASTTVTPVVNQADATVTVNGSTVASGSASAVIALVPGQNTITVAVTAQDGTTQRTYTVTITRLSTDASLSALEVSSSSLTPAFLSGTLTYSVTTAADSLIVTPQSNQVNATILVNDVPTNSGDATAPIPLTVGENTITIDVTAQDGVTERIYIISITRLSNDASLSDLTLSSGSITPSLDSTINSYTITTTVESTTVTATVNQADATLAVNGLPGTSGVESAPLILNLGENELRIDVTAQDGVTVQTYTVTIIRLSTDATLADLTFAAGTLSPEFSAGITRYTLAATAASSSVTPTANQSDATITVDGVPVESGAANLAIPLVAGNTTITVEVTAQDRVTTETYEVFVNAFELLDPTPGAFHEFGSAVVQLANGNILVSDPRDSNVVSGSGAFHLYDPSYSMPIASFYQYTSGSGTVTELRNNNFVISTTRFSIENAPSVGSVFLVDGDTGEQIGETIVGDVQFDSVGSGGIVELSNSNFVVASPSDSEGGVMSAGSVQLVDGETGEPIGPPIVGDVAYDGIGGQVISLTNNNFVVSSPFDNEGGVERAGSLRLVDGNTGAQIGPPLIGDLTNDLSWVRVTALSNGNYVVIATLDDENGVVDAGSVRLMDGTTGLQIAVVAIGDVTADLFGPEVYGNYFGRTTITELSNNNFVVASPHDDENGIVDAGSVRLINGNTGVQIGATIIGDAANDQLGSAGITELDNNIFIIGSSFDDDGAVANVGSVQMINGNTGSPIASILRGDSADDGIGAVIKGIGHSNFLVVSSLDDVGGIVDAGSVRVINGSSGNQIGSGLSGDMPGDFTGSGRVVALENGNFAVISSADSEGGVANAGSIRLVNGRTGEQIGNALIGDVPGDFQSPTITTLSNGNYVVKARSDDEAGVEDASSVRLMSGSAGGQIGPAQVGDVERDDLGNLGITVLNNDNYVIVSSRDDENGIYDAGSVRVIDGSTGVEVSERMIGTRQGVQAIRSVSGNSYILTQKNATKNAMINAGMVRIVFP